MKRTWTALALLLALSLAAVGTARAQPFPLSGTSLTENSSGNNANAQATASIVGVAGKTGYVCGASFTGAGATAASDVTAVISGLSSGNSLNFTFVAPTGATVQATPLILNFNPCLAGNPGGNINAILPALGAGNTNAAASIWGYYQ